MTLVGHPEPRLVDEAERDRIVRSGLDETLFVEAGAGTGKTHALVGRVEHLVIDAGIRLDTIAAITFTEAAAAELRDRIRERFERRLDDPGLDPATAARCEQALADADDAAIGTLHGFCLRILGEHPVDVKLPPRVEILDEVRSQLAFEERWSAFVDDLFSDPTAEELILRAWALGVAVEPRGGGSVSLKDVASVLDDSWDRLDAVAAEPDAPLAPVDFSAVDRAVAGLREIATTCRDPQDGLLAKIEQLRHELTAIAADAGADTQRRLALYRSYLPRWRRGNSGAAKWWDDKAAAQAAYDEAKGAVEAVRDAATDEVLRALTRRLARFILASAEHRRAEGQLEFHDLLVLARQLVRESGAARRSLHDRYTRLLLDEFQDTDPIQIEVAVLIAAAVTGDDELVDSPWSAVATDTGRLFFVGDPKQSIYRFRRADIALFLAARDTFSGSAGPLQLRENFRTVAPIVDWVNAVFSLVMAAEVPGAQPAYQPLSAHRHELAVDHRPVVLGGPLDLKAGELRAAEAADVAEAVAAIRDAPDRWQIQDKATGEWREPCMGDITVLLPTRTSLRALEDAFDAQRIPYRVDTGTLVYDTQEVRDVLDALRAVDDPADTITVVAALRSPLFACTDVDLFTWKHAGGRFGLRDRRPDGVGDDHPVARAMRCLEALWESRWWSEPSALMQRLLDERQAFTLAFGARRPREVWRRLRFLVDQARAFEEAGGGDLRAFLAWADLQRNEGSRVHEPILPETDDDAVSILTIHGSKGLEFPITIVAGATTEMRGGRRGVQVLWDSGRPAVKLNAAVRSDNFDRLADLEAEMDLHERQRLLYVACTRARDHLIVCAHHKPGRKSFGGWLTEYTAAIDGGLWRELPAAPERPEDRPAPGEALQLPLLAAGDERQSWLRGRRALLAAGNERRFESATTIAARAGVVRDGDVDGGDGGAGVDRRGDDAAPVDVDETSDGPPIPWRRGRAGTAIGRAVHATLQLVDLDSGAGLDALAAQQAHLEAVPGDAATVAALARSALSAPAVLEAIAATRRWRELYVAAPTGTRAIEGYVDLLFEGDRGLVLVDYKTDAVAGEADIGEKIERYRIQTAAYALALEVATGQPVVEARLVFCKTGGAVERVVPDLASAIAEVRTLLDA